MDKYVILQNVSDAGLKNLERLQSMGQLSILSADTILIDHLSSEELRRIIIDCAREHGYKLSENKVENLINEIYDRWLYGFVSVKDVKFVIEDLLEEGEI